jgi:hypothetical protein
MNYLNNIYKKIQNSTSYELHPAPTEMHSTEVLFSPGSPATFPTSRIKASGFASRLFRRFAFSSVVKLLLG